MEPATKKARIEHTHNAERFMNFHKFLQAYLAPRDTEDGTTGKDARETALWRWLVGKARAPSEDKGKGVKLDVTIKDSFLPTRWELDITNQPTLDVPIPVKPVFEECWYFSGTDNDGRIRIPRALTNWFWLNPAHRHGWPMEFLAIRPNAPTPRPKSGNAVCITWFVCSLKAILPDTSKVDWVLFDCSHLCINGGRPMARQAAVEATETEAGQPAIPPHCCMNPAHLVWETKGENQSRGSAKKNPLGPLCRRICHCGCLRIVCAADRLHSPCCL